MGAVTFSIDRDLVRLLKDALNLSVFVETGTFEGDTIESVRDLFDRIVSVEISDAYYRKSAERFLHAKNVELVLGESPAFLQRMAGRLSPSNVQKISCASYPSNPSALTT